MFIPRCSCRSLSFALRLPRQPNILLPRHFDEDDSKVRLLLEETAPAVGDRADDGDGCP